MTRDLLDEADIREGLDLTPAVALARFMSDLSEDYYCAGWLSQCEHRLWGMVEHGDRREWGFGEVTEAEVETLRRLSREADGWAAHRPGRGVVFVPMAEWRLEDDAYRAKHSDEDWAIWQRGARRSDGGDRG